MSCPTGLGIPEEFGGQGYGPVELYVVFERWAPRLFCSRTSRPSPRRERRALRRHGRGQGGVLPGIASGETIATVALTDDAGLWDLTKTSTTASASR